MPFCYSICLAQADRFDIATFKSPKGWKKETLASAIQFSSQDATSGAYCVMIFYKSVPGTPNPTNNFDLSWSSLVKSIAPSSATPTMQPQAKDGAWQVNSGYSTFDSDGDKGTIVLVNSSCNDKMVNLIIITNTDKYEKDITSFVNSIKLQAPDKPSYQPSDSNNNVSLTGTWGKGNSVGYLGGSFGRWSYTREQYIFNTHGSYSFARKVYVQNNKETLLTKETGTYKI